MTSNEGYFLNAVKVVLSVHNKRRKKYGDLWNEMGLEGNFYMIKSKFLRLQYNFLHKSNNYEGEMDTLIDLIVYSFFQLAMLIMRKKK